MKQVLLAFALGAAFSAAGQIAVTGKPEPLMRGTQSQLFNPVLSADGSKLLVSESDFSNLRIYDFNSGACMQICSDLRSGFDAQFTPDGSKVVYVAQTFDNSGKALRQLRQYDINAGTNTNMSELSHSVGRPAVANSGTETVINGKVKTNGKKLDKLVRTEGSNLYITVNGKENCYSPVPSQAGYCWESLSPDGTKVMFFAAGKGIIICDLNGNILRELGNYESPVWFGNNHVVAMHATDDGHQYRSSQIVLLDTKSSAMQELTKPESMTMCPTASFQSSKIVYNTIDGLLYQMSVTLK